MQREETPFQKRCRGRLLQRAHDLGRELAVEKVVGEDEDYLHVLAATEPVRLEIFIYEDEAGFYIGNSWCIFEVDDFDSEEALMQAFFDALEDHLVRI